MADFEPKLITVFLVSAYDESGYGDNRSKDFTDGNAAVEYAKSLPKNFGAIVTKKITMEPLYIQIYP